MNPAIGDKSSPNLSFYWFMAMSLMLLAAAILLTACGGGGGSDGDTPAVNTGIFIDAPVQGLNYHTAAYSGTTDSGGSFNYQAGEQITFAIGNVVLGSTVAKSIITPLDSYPKQRMRRTGR